MKVTPLQVKCAIITIEQGYGTGLVVATGVGHPVRIIAGRQSGKFVACLRRHYNGRWTDELIRVWRPPTGYINFYFTIITSLAAGGCERTDRLWHGVSTGYGKVPGYRCITVIRNLYRIVTR